MPLFGSAPQWIYYTQRRRAPSRGAYTITVWVREVLIDIVAGAPLVGQSGITALIFHSAAAVEAGTPNQIVTGVTTDGAGATGFQIDRQSLTPGDPIYLILFRDGSPARFGARRIVPSYE